MVLVQKQHVAVHFQSASNLYFIHKSFLFACLTRRLMAVYYYVDIAEMDSTEFREALNKLYSIFLVEKVKSHRT